MAAPCAVLCKSGPCEHSAGVRGSSDRWEDQTEQIVLSRPAEVAPAAWNSVPDQVSYQKWCGFLCSSVASKPLRDFQRELQDHDFLVLALYLSMY